MAQQQTTTFGNAAVRSSFNPSNSPLVGQIKQQTASLLDLCHDNLGEGPESDRCWQQAQLAYETAAMWAVKAATTGMATTQKS